MARINFKTTDQMNDQELVVAYTLYFLIAFLTSIAIIWFDWDAPRGIFIALWGLPIGVVAMWFFRPSMVKTRHIGREFVIAMLGFIAYGVYMIAIGDFTIFTVYDIYYYLIGIAIFELGLVLFYAFYLATDNLEQRGYHLLSVPLASITILVATYVALYLTRVYI